MENLIQVNSNNTPITTSLKIAEVFGRQHKNVMRAINQMYMPKNFRELNFEPSSYTNEQNKEQPMYNITKDGFVLLVMGFTGKKATEFKIAYINAFNEMENYLRGSTKVLTSPDLALVGGTVKRCVKSAIRELVENFTPTSVGCREVSDQDIMTYLYWWNATKFKDTTERMRTLNAENTRMREQLAHIEQAFK